MRDLQQIEAFVAVAEHGSFVAAARVLGVSSSYASKLVSRLEQRLGARLIQRTTRRHTLTPQGEQYLADCQDALERLRRAEEDLHDAVSAVRGEIRVTAPTGLGLGALAELFDRFALRHPEVRLSVSYLDRFVDLIGERYDLAVRAGQLPDSSLRARRVGRYCKGLYASPDVAEALGPVAHPDALRGVAAVVYTGSDSPLEWTLSSGGQTATVAVESRVQSNSGRAVALSAASGLGVAYLPTFHTCDLERRGRLVRLLPRWSSEVPVHVVFPTSRHLPLRVRALIDFLADDLDASTF